MKTELEGQIDGTLGEHQIVFDQWREEFNTVRPHEAFDMKVPADIYSKSIVKYPGEYIELRYGKGLKRRYVNDRGYINFDNKRIFIGNPFNGYHVGIKEMVDKPMEIWFSEMKLGTINPDNGLMEPDFGSIKSLIST
jgi:hypothetical protein